MKINITLTREDIGFCIKSLLDNKDEHVEFEIDLDEFEPFAS